MNEEEKNFMNALLEGQDGGPNKGISVGPAIVKQDQYGSAVNHKQQQTEDLNTPVESARDSHIIRTLSKDEVFTTAYANVDCDLETGTQRVESYLTKNDTDFHKPSQNTFYGYTFEQSKQACFKFEFVKIEKQLALLCRRLDGDAFILTNFFESLKQGCEWGDEIEEEDDTLFPEDYEDEEDELINELKSNTFYLKLEKDPEIMQAWLSDLNGEASPEDTRGALLLMAWNIKREANLNVMQKYQSQLVETLLKIIQAPSSSLPEVQCSAKILQNLLTAKSNASKLDNDALAILTECLYNWSPAAGRANSFNIPVPVSNNIQVIISGIFSSSMMTFPKDMQASIEKVRETTAHKHVVNNLSKIN